MYLNSKNKCYLVVYEDGDKEEYSENEIDQ
jgi:hypothetical protein